MRRRTKWLAGLAVGIPLAGGLTLVFLAKRYASRIEPFIRDQAVLYLRDRFHADVAIGNLRIDVPALSPVNLYLSKGRGVMAAVTGEGISLSQNGQPLLQMQSMRFDVDVGELQRPHKGVKSVQLDGVVVNIPPKGERPAFSGTGAPSPDVLIDEVILTNARLLILPRDKTRRPLQFDIHRVRFTEAGVSAPMRYTAELRNAKPPGEIHAVGHFGPWNRDEPGDSPLDGDYSFEKADLGVFNAIGGVLHSTGHFQGQLNDLQTTGEATVPAFYLKSSGNRLPLRTKFEARVDGTNGNTILKPVHGRIGKTPFVTSGAVVKNTGDQRRTIELDVNMNDGRLEDVLLLAMKGSDPYMSGALQMKSHILVPPLSGKVIEKLQLKGEFTIKDAKFLRSQLQERLDQMSRQAQGQPKNEEIVEVLSGLSGKFELDNQLVTLREMAFSIPGADLRLSGTYNLEGEAVDFRGDLRLQARLSQTQAGWKRWALKPVDPFFAKNGAGVYTKIQITGTRKEPKFGRAK